MKLHSFISLICLFLVHGDKYASLFADYPSDSGATVTILNSKDVSTRDGYGNWVINTKTHDEWHLRISLSKDWGFGDSFYTVGECAVEIAVNASKNLLFAFTVPHDNKYIATLIGNNNKIIPYTNGLCQVNGSTPMQIGNPVTAIMGPKNDRFSNLVYSSSNNTHDFDLMSTLYGSQNEGRRRIKFTFNNNEGNTLGVLYES
eukprot:369227_1